jgi:hypothetical protein
VDSVPEANSEVAGESLGILENLIKSAALQEGIGREDQRQEAAVRLLEEIHVELNKRLSPATTTDADILPDGMEPYDRVRYDKYEREVFFLSLGHSIGNRRESGKTRV